MKSFLILTIAIILAIPATHAQYNTPQNMKWAFGYGAGLDFSSGSPVVFATAINTIEGCASVCDASGNLLFYSDGTNVWDNTHTVMPAGTAVVSYSTGSSAQGALIAPVLGNPNQYYLFSMEDVSSGGTGYCRLNYCIVDMTLHGGLGDVVASTIGTYIGNVFGEKMCLAAGNSCDLWLVTHYLDSPVFASYHITTSGITGPVRSRSGGFTGYEPYGIGHIKISPDRLHLALTGYSVASGLELHDFDPNTGIVSNFKLLDSLGNFYGAEFSPNSNILYGDDFGTGVFQFDITAGSAAAIRATRTTIVSTAISGDLKLAPNGKIYFGHTIFGNTIDCIPNPNTAGTGCGLNVGVATLTGSHQTTGGLPNVYITPSGGDTSTKRYDTSLCLPTAGITIAADTTGASYLWSTGEFTSTKNVTAYGTYWVYIRNSCAIKIDTFRITKLPQDTTTRSRDTVLCNATGSFTLDAPGGYSSYLWNTAAATASITAIGSGLYYVYCSLGCDLLIDTLKVNALTYITSQNVKDTNYCFPGELILSAVAGNTGYTWQDGSIGADYKATAQGTYWVVSQGDCETHTDSFHVTSAPLSVDLGPDVSTCMNYTILPSVKNKEAAFLWQDGSTTSTYSASRTGTYYVTVKLGGCVASDTMSVNFIRLMQNIPDTFICKGMPIELTLTATIPPGGSIVWEDGSRSADRIVRDSGTYWVYVKQFECEILDTVRVTTGFCDCWYNVPTAFTPNADGLNDIIKPVIQPGCTTSGYQFSIYNRWGEEVFSTNMPGKGWDGTFKGTAVDMGTYYYSLTLYMGIHNKQASKSGSFTLIR